MKTAAQDESLNNEVIDDVTVIIHILRFLRLGLCSKHDIQYDNLISNDAVKLITDLSIESDSKWTYVVWNLSVLNALYKSLKVAVEEYRIQLHGYKKAPLPNEAPPINPKTFGNIEQKTLITAVQFVIGMGLMPYLYSGVGVSMQQRSKFGSALSVSLLSFFLISSLQDNFLPIN